MVRRTLPLARIANGIKPAFAKHAGADLQNTPYTFYKNFELHFFFRNSASI
jgi:hypothetical protein